MLKGILHEKENDTDQKQGSHKGSIGDATENKMKTSFYYS